MLKTEHEARTKWCPHGRMSSFVVLESDEVASFSNNRTMSGKRSMGCNCIASECMAWRWKDAEHQTHCKLAVDKSDPTIAPSGDGWRVAVHDDEGILWRRVNPDRRGYCGLAGPVGE